MKPTGDTHTNKQTSNVKKDWRFLSPSLPFTDSQNPLEHERTEPGAAAVRDQDAPPKGEAELGQMGNVSASVLWEGWRVKY